MKKNIERFNTLKKEPIRHHYIPQFILRNFCVDEEGNTLFVDIKSKKQSKKKVRDLFMGRNLYRDTINNENPVKIEEDLARFENEVAPIIKEKFLNKDEFVLTQYENEKLKLFFALMSFRSKSTQELFQKELSKESKELYSLWQQNKNFEDLWKRNLGYIVKCRSLNEIINNTKIDEPIKCGFIREIVGVSGKYFCIVEPKDVGEFILSDCYPVAVCGAGMLPSGVKVSGRIYDVYTLSPKRAILFANVGCQDTPRNVLKMRPLVLNEPFPKNKNEILFSVKKLFLEEVEIINDMVMEHAKEGYIFRGEKEYL